MGIGDRGWGAFSQPLTPIPQPPQAILLVGFGGPEKPADVIPFLENVLRGRNVPRERVLEVANHYYHFGGISPINQHMRELMAALEAELRERGPALPLYWGNRNWEPMLADTIGRMRSDGIRRAAAFVMSAYSSYSGCRQYLEDIARARETVGPGAPDIQKLRIFYNHPGFIEPVTGHVLSAFERIPEERRRAAALVFTAHSIPVLMAATSLSDGNGSALSFIAVKTSTRFTLSFVVNTSILSR